MSSFSWQVSSVRRSSSLHVDFLRPICVVLFLIPIVRAQGFSNYFEDGNIFSQPASGRRIFDTPPIARGQPVQREAQCSSTAGAEGKSGGVANRFDEGNPLSNVIQRHRRNYQQQKQQQQQQQRSAGPPPAAFSGRRIFPPNEDEAPSFRFGPSSVGGRRIFPTSPSEGDDRPRRRIDASKSQPAEKAKKAVIPMTINLGSNRWGADEYEDSDEYIDERDDDGVDMSAGPGYRILFNDDYGDANLDDYQDNYPQANFRMFY